MIQVGDPNTKDSTKFDRIGMVVPAIPYPMRLHSASKPAKTQKAHLPLQDAVMPSIPAKNRADRSLHSTERRGLQTP